jgi:uncharacterized protein YukE
MPGATGPTPLAPFSHDWVGGDIHGLSNLAGTLYGYAPKVTDVASALDAQVRTVVGAAGWQGQAASSFSTAWEKDSKTARAVGVASDQVGGIVDWLAVSLSKVESDLEQAAAAASSHGVAIGPNGAPPAACFGPPANAKEAAAQQWTNAYQKYYQDCMQSAQTARQTAAGALTQTVTQVTGTTGHGVTPSDGNTVGDLLGDLIAAPSAVRRKTEAAVEKIMGDIKANMQDFLAHKISYGALVSDLNGGIDKLATADDAVTTAKASEGAISKALDVRAGDAITKVQQLLSGPAGTAEPVAGADGGGAADAGKLSKIVDFGKDIPVLDILAGMAGTGLSTYQDVRDGQSLATALPEEAASNTAGVTTGILAGGGASALVGGGLVGGVLGAGVGGVVAVGVGDFTNHLFHENWGGDIHKYGVAVGVLDGIGDSAKKTGGDIVNLGKDLGHTASSLWHGATSWL